MTASLDQVREGSTALLRNHQSRPRLRFQRRKFTGTAYKLARKKKEVSLLAVQVNIHEFEITSYENERAEFCARVASGTYDALSGARSGSTLGCGAHLESLRRTRVAEFSIADAHTLEQVEAAWAAGKGDDICGASPQASCPTCPR